MGIREEIEKENKEKIALEIQAKNFRQVGYWIRTIKSKIKDSKLINLTLKIEVEYVKRGE